MKTILFALALTVVSIAATPTLASDAGCGTAQTLFLPSQSYLEESTDLDLGQLSPVAGAQATATCCESCQTAHNRCTRYCVRIHPWSFECYDSCDLAFEDCTTSCGGC